MGRRNCEKCLELTRRLFVKTAAASSVAGGAGLSAGAAMARPATVPVDALSGEPSYRVGRDIGFYLWRAGGVFHLQWTGDTYDTGDNNVVEFEVTTDGSVSVTGRESWNATDYILEETDDRVHCRAAVGPGYDGVDLDVSDATEVTFDLRFSDDIARSEWRSMSYSEQEEFVKTVDTERRPDLVYLGGDETVPGGLPLTVSLSGRTTGFTGQYYNLSRNHPDMQSGSTSRDQGLVQETLPLRLTDAGESEYEQFDWWDAQYFSFSRVDETLDWPSDFHPLDEGKPGDPFHFAVHWTATMEVPEAGTYSFATVSDDESWLFVDGNLVVDNGGLHGRRRRSGSVDLDAGEYDVDIFFAERQTTGSNFTLEAPDDVTFYTRDSGGGRNRFDTLAERKLGLADRIDAISSNIDERPRVEASLDDLGSRLEDGDLDSSTAVEAVERMILGENVTEGALAAVGPAGDDGDFEPDGFDRHVDTPDDIEGFNTAKLAVEGFISTFVSLLLSNQVFKKVKGSLPGWAAGKVDTAIKKVEDAFDWLARAVLGRIDDLLRAARGQSYDLAETLGDNLAAGGQEAAQKAATQLFDEIADVEDELARILVGFFETTPANSFDDALEDLDDDLSGDPVEMDGDLDDAAAAAQDGLDEIRDDVHGAKQAYDFLGIVTAAVEWFEIIGVALAATGILFKVGAFVKVAALVINTLFNVVKSLIGVGTVHAVADQHQETLDRVVSPYGGV